MGFFDAFTLWLAVAGLCACVLFGVRRGFLQHMIAPAIVSFVVIPALVSLLPRGSEILRYWYLLIALALVAPIVLVVLAVRLWVLFLRAAFGHAGERAAGVHLVQLIDWFLGRREGRAIPRWEQADE